MATSDSKNSGGYQGRVLKFEWGTNTTNSYTNVRNIWYKITAVGGSSSYYYHHNETIDINGTRVYTGSDSHQVYTNDVLASGNMDINQNDTMTLTVEMHGGIYSYDDNISTTKSWPLDEIPRYLTITGFSVKSKTINTAVISWATSDPRSSTHYSLNGGEWIGSATHGENVASDQKSGTFNIKNLSPNTTYKLKIDCIRSDSGLTTVSNEISFTTYDYAKLSSVPNVNIGSAHTITWTNPSGATTSLKLCKTDNSSIIDYGTVTGTSKSLTPTASTIYALTPNSNTYKARYILTTTQNSKTYTDYKDFTFTVTNSNPTFSNFTYKDTNATTVALTGNNQILVKGYSNVSATISTTNKAVAKNSATMKTYKLVIGTKSTNTKAYSSTADVTLDTINSINSGTIIVYATDSRGNSTSATKNATYKNYADLVIKSFTATRSNNGVGQAVTLKFSGTYWANSFGKVTNAITSVKYFYKVSSASSWQTGATTLTYTASNGNFSGSLSVQGDLGANGFDVSKSFNIRLQVTDKLVTKTYDITLGSGTPAIAIYKNKVAIGQKYDPSVNAKLQVAGGINIPNGSSTEPYNSYQIGGEPVMRYTGDATIISGKRSIYLRPNGTTDSKGQVFVDTNGNANLSGKLTIGSFTANTTDTLIPVIKNGEIQYTQRKFASSKTHTDYNNNQDLLPTMSFLSYWNGAYDSGNNSNLTYCYQGTIQAKPTSLYDNTSGSNGTITLSETAANFSYLEIFFGDSKVTAINSVKVFSPNGKTVSTTICTKSDTDIRINTRRLTISGNTITPKDYQVNFIPGGSKYTVNEQLIYKVIGYK